MLLTGWKSIASYLGAGVRTVQRWEVYGLPVRRPLGNVRGPVLAYTDDLERWVKARPANNGNGHSHGDATNAALQAYRQSKQLRGETATLRRELSRHSRALRDQVHQMRSQFGRVKVKAYNPDGSSGR